MEGILKTYNQRVSTITLNRILIILGCLGLFVAGVLSGEHLFQIQIPCSASGGCETVARHPRSYLGGIPVAYFGLAGYALLTGLAILRGFTGKYQSKFLTISGYVGSAIGMVASLYLQYISLTEIHALCYWCLSSALIMVLTFVFYTILFGRMGTLEVEEKSTLSLPALYLGVIGVMVSLGAAFAVIRLSPYVGSRIEIVDASLAAKLVPEPKAERNQYGPDDAPVTIVEYADLCCPQCRKSFPKVKELIGKYPGKIRLIYRYFPIYTLQGHEMALPAVIAAELAGQKGKFWEFASAFSAPEEAPKTREGLDAIAKDFGVTTAEIDKAIADDNSLPQKHLARDYQDALETFKISSTPTYIITGNGLPMQKVLLIGVMNALETPEYQKLLKP